MMWTHHGVLTPDDYVFLFNIGSGSVLLYDEAVLVPKLMLYFN